jgi:PAS domain S-box-containing protein
VRQGRFRLYGYAIAIAATAVAILVRWVTDPWLNLQLRVGVIYGAVALGTYAGGPGPGILAAILGYGVSAYIFIKPRGSFIHDRDAWVGFGLYLGTSLIIVLLMESLRKARQRAKANEDLLRVTLRSIGDAVITTDTEGRVTYLNPVATTLTGWTAREALGKPLEEVFRIVNEETRDTVESPVVKSLREGLVVGLANHTVLIAKDGSECPIDDSAAPIRDRDGGVSGVVMVFRDVRERRRAEQTRWQMALIVESSEDAIIGKDLSGIITSWNKGAERLYGYSAEEMVGKSAGLLIPLDRPDEFPNILERLRRGDRIAPHETIRVRKDGERINVSVGISPVRNEAGTIIGGSTVARDMRQVKKSEQRLRLLSETAAVMLRAENPDSMLRDLFAKIRGQLGLDTYFNFMVNDNGDALRLESFAGISPEAAESIRRLEFGQAICGRVALEHRPIVYTHIQDSQDAATALVKSFGIRVYACNPLLAGDKLLGTLSFASRSRDSFDSAELDFLQTLSNYVAVAYERLRWVRQLREDDRRKDEFLATLAHELRNPLAPIRNAIQLLKAKGPQEPELVWGREVIDRQVQHMTRLLEDLLDVSRISHNKLELRKEKVELAEVIRHAVETSRPAIEAGGHDLSLDLAREPVFINVDPVRVAQVFSNLLSNAAKYTKPGGHIRLVEDRKGSDVLVTVRDDGIGISADMLPHVFDMFSQAQRMRDQSQGGLGIGLSLVRSILELHGGSIEAKSEGVDKGSDFIVRLPLVVEPMMMPDRPALQELNPKAIAPRRILVADDLKDSADTLAVLLRAMGHEVKTAYDGEEAVLAASIFRPEIVLLDIGMPKLNGYDACRKIRAESWGKSLCLVALTGWGQDDDRAKTEEAGFDAHLVKPADPDALIRLLDTAPKRPQASRT